MALMRPNHSSERGNLGRRSSISQYIRLVTSKKACRSTKVRPELQTYPELEVFKIRSSISNPSTTFFSAFRSSLQSNSTPPLLLPYILSLIISNKAGRRELWYQEVISLTFARVWMLCPQYLPKGQGYFQHKQVKIAVLSPILSPSGVSIQGIWPRGLRWMYQGLRAQFPIILMTTFSCLIWPICNRALTALAG